MEVLLRTIAILIELSVLIALLYHVLNGVRLMLFDQGVKAKYARIVVMALIAMGGLIVAFLIPHLITFYPGL